MNSMEEEKIITGEEEQRSPSFKVFLIMSLIYGGLSVFSNLVVYGMIDFIRQTFEGKEQINFMGMDLDLSLFMNTDKNFFLFQTILFVFSFAGALYMWNGRKIGFHLYTGAQILLLIVATVYLTGMPFPFFDVVLTALFIYVYAKNLKFLK